MTWGWGRRVHRGNGDRSDGNTAGIGIEFAVGHIPAVMGKTITSSVDRFTW